MSVVNRKDRNADDIRIVSLSKGYGPFSIICQYGNTIVQCCATIDEGVPRFLRDERSGWLTAEYSMLPTATKTRNHREAARGKISGRTMEIQRLIGRALRYSLDLKLLGERTITVDCDVLQADGGTRMAAVTGGYVAVVKAIRELQYDKKLLDDPVKRMLTGVSVGLVSGKLLLDLDYIEDSAAAMDLNVVMTDQQELVEIQGAAERQGISRDDLNKMIDLAAKGIKEIQVIQNKYLMEG